MSSNITFYPTHIKHFKSYFNYETTSSPFGEKPYKIFKEGVVINTYENIESKRNPAAYINISEDGGLIFRIVIVI